MVAMGLLKLRKKVPKGGLREVEPGVIFRACGGERELLYI